MTCLSRRAFVLRKNTIGMTGMTWQTFFILKLAGMNHHFLREKHDRYDLARQFSKKLHRYDRYDVAHVVSRKTTRRYGPTHVLFGEKLAGMNTMNQHLFCEKQTCW